MLLLVFSVTPFKIDQNKSKNRVQLIKSRIWEKKEGKYAKPLTKIQVTAIFPMEDMPRNFSCKFIEMYGDVMLPIQMGTNMAAANLQKHLSVSFATKSCVCLSKN